MFESEDVLKMAVELTKTAIDSSNINPTEVQVTNVNAFLEGIYNKLTELNNSMED